MINKAIKEFSGVRLISVLTPDTFLKQMIVISTLIKTENGEGETAIAYANGLNSLAINFNELTYKTVCKHKNNEEAQRFHFEFVNRKKFTDCPEQVKQ